MMLRVFGSFSLEHDPLLVLLVVAICAFGAISKGLTLLWVFTRVRGALPRGGALRLPGTRRPRSAPT
jgi:hypothetical protein